MMECKTCNVEMTKIYSFDQDDKTWYFKCPMCGFKTRPNPISFDDNGRVVTKKQSKNLKFNGKSGDKSFTKKGKKNKRFSNKENKK